MAQVVRNLIAMQETWVQSLGWEDSLEKEMATHSNTPLPGELHEQRSQAGYSPWNHKESDTTVRLTFNFFFFKTTLFTIGLTLWPGDQIYVRKSIIESQFPCLLAVWSWANYLTSLNITFLSKEGTMDNIGIKCLWGYWGDQMDDISKELHKL